MTVNYQGETISKYFYFKDKDDAALDPDEFTCTIYNPLGISVANPTLLKVADGQYEMDYNLAEDAPEGQWKIVVTGTVTGTPDYIGVMKEYFEVRPV